MARKKAVRRRRKTKRHESRLGELMDITNELVDACSAVTHSVGNGQVAALKRVHALVRKALAIEVEMLGGIGEEAAGGSGTFD